VTASDFRVYSDGGAVTQGFASGATYSMTELYLYGSAGRTQYLLTAGTGAWRLVVADIAFVKSVAVAGSDASGGHTIEALASVDGGGNTNWSFGGDWKLWTGATSTSFTNGANWLPAGAPTAGSFVLIDDPHPARLASPVTVYRLVVGGSTQATLEANAPLTVQENLQVLPGGVVTHSTNGSVAQYSLALSVTGDLTISTGARIDVDGKGYARAAGPGASILVPVDGQIKRSGGSYGGKGAQGDHALPGYTYGTVLTPTNLGSGGSSLSASSGGGAVLLTVGGATRVDGVITAGGTNEDISANGGGSGGSVFLVTANLAGSGLIQANGGQGYINNGNSGSGGGGRIAIQLTGPGNTDAVVARARGGINGAYSGGAGSVYRATAAQAGGSGTVTFDNGGLTMNGYSELPGILSPDQADELERAVLVLTNVNTRLALTTNATVGDLLVHTNTSLVLGNNLLFVKSMEHRLDNARVRGAGGTNRVDHYTQIIWTRPGTVIMVH
jgi:hypothetical protein